MHSGICHHVLEGMQNFCCFKLILQCKPGVAAVALGKSEPTRSLKTFLNINQSHSLGGFSDYCRPKIWEFCRRADVLPKVRRDEMEPGIKIIGPGFKC